MFILIWSTNDSDKQFPIFVEGGVKHHKSLTQYLASVSFYCYFCIVEFHSRRGPSWSWSYGSWIYNYLCNQSLLPLMLWVRISHWRGVLDTTLWEQVYMQYSYRHWQVGTEVDLRQIGGFLLVLRFPSSNKTDRDDITEILLKVALNTTTLTLQMKETNNFQYLTSVSFHCYFCIVESGYTDHDLFLYLTHYQVIQYYNLFEIHRHVKS